MKINIGFIVLLLPLIAFIMLFIVPLMSILTMSFYHYEGVLDYRSPLTMENYIQTFESTSVRLAFLRTATIALSSSMLAVMISYPVSYYLSWSTARRTKTFVVAVILFSLFASTIARGLSWIYILGPLGVAGMIFGFVGLSGITLLHTELSVVIGLTYIVVPFATLTMLGPLQKIRPVIRDAAMILGASKFETFMYVTLPLSIPGVTAALAVCLTITLAAFVIPLMLGGGIVDMVSNLIYGRVRETLNFPLGSAMSIVLLCFSIGVMYVATVLTKRMGRG